MAAPTCYAMSDVVNYCQTVITVFSLDIQVYQQQRPANKKRLLPHVIYSLDPGTNISFGWVFLEPDMFKNDDIEAVLRIYKVSTHLCIPEPVL